jgi:hypothetical protein
MLQANSCRKSTQAESLEPPEYFWDDIPLHLLEDILSLLPAEQIRKSSQVSRHWRAAAEAPLKSACLRAGLKMPASGVRTWSGLQAHAERLAMHWRGTPLALPPTYTIVCPHTNRDPWSFLPGALNVSRTGIHVNGKDRFFIELPKIGSDAALHTTMLPPHAQGDKTTTLHCCGMRATQGYVLYSEYIQLFTNIADKTPLADIRSAPFSACGACSTDLFATGHRDGTRLWSLPDLQLSAHIPNTRPIENVGLSENSKCLIVRSPDRTADLWDLTSIICVKTLECDNYFFDDRRDNILCLNFINTGYPDSECRLKRYTFEGILLNVCLLPYHYISAYLPNPGLYNFWTEKNVSRFIDDTNEVLLCNMRLALDFSWTTLPAEIATSQDGRWIIILTNCGDVLIWDVYA